MICGCGATMKYRISIDEGFEINHIHTGDLHTPALNFHLTEQPIYTQAYQIESDFRRNWKKNLTT